MIKFEMHTKLPSEIVDKLRDQKVDMDDWDYLLFIDIEFSENFNRLKVDEDSFYRGNLEAKSYLVDKLLNGCCTNAWYEVSDFMGKRGIVGLAYHS